VDVGVVLLVSMFVSIVEAIDVRCLPYKLIRTRHNVGNVLKYATIASTAFIGMVVVFVYPLLLAFFHALNAIEAIVIVIVSALKSL